MKKVLLFAALAIAALVSCNKEIYVEEVVKPDAVPEGYVPVTLNALYDQDTKASLVDNMIIWDMEEELAVFADGAGDPIKFVVSNSYTLGSSVGVSISGSVPEGTKSFVAVYPWQEGLSCVDGVVSLNIPEEQHIPAECVVDPKAMPSVAYFAGADSYGTFRNVMSLIKFNVGKTEGVEEVRVVFGEGAYSAGAVTAKIDTENDGAPEIGNNCDAYATVTAEGGFLPETDYWISVAPVKSAGIKAVARVDNKAYNKVSDKEIVLERNKGVNLGDITLEASIKFVGIKNAEDLVAFLADAGSYTKDDVVEFTDNIDMSGVTLVEDVEGSHAAASAFAGVLDGCGYSIINWAADGVGLFKTVTGSVKGITIDSSCSFNNVPAGVFSFLVSNLNDGAYVGDCVNKVSVIIDAGDGTVQYRYGSLVGVSQKSALVENCDNYGDIDFTLTTGADKMTSQYIGGIIACTNGPSDELRINNCNNYGKCINVVLINGVGGNVFNNTYVGGIAASSGINSGSASKTSGYTLNYGTYADCTNNASISASWEGGTGGYFKVGGIVGYGECSVVGCTNNGDVTVVATSEKAASNSSPSVGGIAGLLAGTAPVNASGCTNNGTVSVSGLFHNANTDYALGVGGQKMTGIGGCIGMLGDRATLVEYCINNGNLIIDTETAATAGSGHSYGGIVGYSKGNIDNCSNSASLLSITDKACYSYMGGIVGTTTASVTNCTSEGKVDFYHNVNALTTSLAKTKIFTGGIAGNIDKDLTGCISFVSGTMVSYGDMTANISGVSGYVSGRIADCHFNGNVDVDYDASVQAKDAIGNIGGVVGYHKTGGTSLTGCSTGESASWTVKVSSAQMRVGGISAMEYTETTDCVNAATIIAERGEDSVKNYATHVGGIIGYHNLESAPVESCSNIAPVSVTLSANSGTSNISAVVGNLQKKTTMKDCSNSGELVVEGAETAGSLRVGGVVGNMATADTDLTGLVNSADVTVTNFNGTGVNNFFGGVLGRYYSSDNDLISCVNTGDVTVDGAGAARVGGLCGGLFGSFTDCSTEGTVTVKRATNTDAATSHIGGLSGYGSASVSGCIVNSTIVVSDLETAVPVGLLFGTVYRELTVKGLTVDSSITGENLNAGYLFGKVNVDDPAQKTIVTLGAEGEPVTIKASCSINGVAVMAQPSTDTDLIADISGKIETQEENILNYVNVVVE